MDEQKETYTQQWLSGGKTGTDVLKFIVGGGLLWNGALRAELKNLIVKKN